MVEDQIIQHTKPILLFLPVHPPTSLRCLYIRFPQGCSNLSSSLSPPSLEPNIELLILSEKAQKNIQQLVELGVVLRTRQQTIVIMRGKSSML